MAERNNVVIQSAVTERPFTYQNRQFTNYEFKAQIEDAETPVKFQTTSKDLAEIITKEGVGSKVELEYTTTVKGDFTNRKVTQVYKDGTTLVTQKSSQGASYKSQGKSPDERASIERQVALKVTSEIYCHCTEAGTPFADKLFKDISKFCKHELGIDSPLVAAIKKEGGVEE